MTPLSIGHTDVVSSLYALKKQPTLISVSQKDKSLRFFNTRTDSLQHVCMDEEINCVLVSSNDEVYTGCKDGTIKVRSNIWTSNQQIEFTCKAKLSNTNSTINSLCFVQASD